MDCESKPMLHVSQQISPADQEQSIVSSDKVTPLYVMIKSASIIAQFSHNAGVRLKFPVFSAECTIWMVWGLTPLKHYGCKVLRCKL